MAVRKVQSFEGIEKFNYIYGLIPGWNKGMKYLYFKGLREIYFL